MTTRLYYQEPYRTTFEAEVRACAPAGARFHVQLDHTAFYPTSGGQPHDVGTLGGATVLDVIDREDGGIVHVVDAAIPVGERVTGVIDWTRRFDHMQQHTGQHVLSAAFDRLFGARTESFHLGTASSTIDLGKEVSAAMVADVEGEANRIVWEDRAVSIRFVTAELAAALPLRKDPARSGSLRLIDVENYDLSACGGTHVARTGAIGMIAVASTEKFRSGTRVEFLCGGRALTRFRAWRSAFAETQRFLSVSPQELPASIERLQADAKSLQRSIRDLQERLAGHEANGLLSRGERIGDGVRVVEALEGWDAVGLKTMAAAAANADPQAAIVLYSAATPALVVVACGKDSGVDASVMLKALVARFGGKGGGKRDLAQGGGLAGDTSSLIGAARELLNP